MSKLLGSEEAKQPENWWPQDSTGKKLEPCGSTIQFVGTFEERKCSQCPGHTDDHKDRFGISWRNNMKDMATRSRLAEEARQRITSTKPSLSEDEIATDPPEIEEDEEDTDEVCPKCGEKGVPYGAHCNMVDDEQDGNYAGENEYGR